MPIPWKRILTSRPVLINAITQWGMNGAIFTLLTFTPMYLKYIHNLSTKNVRIYFRREIGKYFSQTCDDFQFLEWPLVRDSTFDQMGSSCKFWFSDRVPKLSQRHKCT